jgi:hypothetical protein
MRKHVAVVCFLALSVPLFAQRQKPPVGLRLAVETKLGVKEDIQVGTTDAPTTLLDTVSFGGLSAHGRSRLVLLAPDSVYYLIPWALVKEGAANQDGHSVVLTDGSAIAGKLETEVSTAGDGRKFNLAGTNKFVTLSAPKSETLNWGGVNPWPPRLPWSLSIAGRATALDVVAAHFVFRYYSTAGYVIGGSDGNVWQALNFVVKIGPDNVAANLPDFETVSVHRENGRDTVTVRAPGAAPVTGQLILSQTDSRGSHDAYSDWILLVTLPNGVDVGVTGKDWELTRRKR